MPEEKSTEKTVFQTLRELDLTDKHKKKLSLTYLPWSEAWATVKTMYPSASYVIIKDDDGNRYHAEGNYAYVETSATIEGETISETLAIMDATNKPIPLDKITSTNVDKSIKRCLTKNFALFGLDLNLWSGEELSDEAKDLKEQQAEEEKKAKAALKIKIDMITSYGNQVIKAGVSKDDLIKKVAELNGGNPNPASVKSIEAADALIKGLEEAFGEAVKSHTEPASENTNKKSNSSNRKAKE